MSTEPTIRERHYSPACLAADVPPAGCKIVAVDGRSIGIFRVADQYYALNNVCPHEGAQVCLGSVTGTAEVVGGYRLRWTREGEILQCPWHAWQFDITTGRSLFEPVRSVKTYPVRVVDGVIMLEL